MQLLLGASADRNQRFPEVADFCKAHCYSVDRLLVAQAICEPLRLLTHDDKLKAYSELVDLV